MSETGDYKAASELCEKAKSLTIGGKTKWLFFTEKPDYQEASEHYNRAGNLFKSVKAWREAGEAFLEAAKCDRFNDEKEESARRLLSAASCFKKVEPHRAIEALKEAIIVFLHAGRFHLAASQEKEIGEIYEEALDDAGNASNYYQRAAERYLAEDQKATALSCQLKAGALAAIVEDYKRASEIFSEVIRQWAGDELKRYSMKDYFLKNGLCLLLADDLVNARREIERFGQADHAFPTTSEGKLLHGVLEALESNDMEKFIQEISTFNNVGLLDDWKTSMLVRLKKKISEEDESLA